MNIKNMKETTEKGIAKGKIKIRITLDGEKHKDVIDALTACPKTMRGEYIVDAIRYARRNLLRNGNKNYRLKI